MKHSEIEKLTRETDLSIENRAVLREFHPGFCEIKKVAGEAVFFHFYNWWIFPGG